MSLKVNLNILVIALLLATAAVLPAKTSCSDSLRCKAFGKGKFLATLDASGGGVINEFNHTNSYALTWHARGSYFVSNRVSVNLGYLGIEIGFSDKPKLNNYYNSFLADVTYYFYVRTSTFLFAQSGYILSQNRAYKAQEDLFRKKPGSLLHAALGIGFKPDNWQRIAIVIKPIFYYNLNRPKEKVSQAWTGLLLGLVFSPGEGFGG